MKSRKGRLLRPEGLKAIPGPQASDVDIQASKLFWASLDAEKKQAVMRFSDARLVEKVVEVQQALCRSDLQCYMLGIRGQDAVREKSGISNFVIMSDDEGQKMEFIAKAPFTERSDLFEYMGAALGTSFLKGRPVLAPEEWHVLFGRAPSSWPEFLRQVLALAEQAILSAYQSSADASKKKSKNPLETMAAKSCRSPELTDEQILLILQETPAERLVSKCAKRKARMKRQALLKRSDGEDGSTLGESVPETASEASSITLLNSILGSSGCTRYPLQSTAASAGIDDDRVSVSTMDTALLPEGTRSAEDEELHVDWSAANPIGPAAALQTVQESVELEVDWNEPEETRWSASMVDDFTGVSAEWHWTTAGTRAAEDEELQVDWSAANPIAPPLQTVQESVELEVDWNEPEETRWSASMVDDFTGVSAEWHWTITPRPMLTCGNLRAHIKNTFFDGIYDSNEFPEELARSKSAPAPRRRRWSP